MENHNPFLSRLTSNRCIIQKFRLRFMNASEVFKHFRQAWFHLFSSQKVSEGQRFMIYDWWLVLTRNSSFFTLIQINVHQTELEFRYVSHDMTWYCLSISDDLPGFTMKWHTISWIFTNLDDFLPVIFT